MFGMSPTSKSRITAKGSARSGRSEKAATSKPQRASGRYTPPKPKSQRKSNPKMLYAIFGPLAVGGLIILTNYLNLLPGGASNWYLLLGLALISTGFFVATNYR